MLLPVKIHKLSGKAHHIVVIVVTVVTVIVVRDCCIGGLLSVLEFYGHLTLILVQLTSLLKKSEGVNPRL